jgi:hypothetical protein
MIRFGNAASVMPNDSAPAEVTNAAFEESTEDSEPVEEFVEESPEEAQE